MRKWGSPSSPAGRKAMSVIGAPSALTTMRDTAPSALSPTVMTAGSELSLDSDEAPLLEAEAPLPEAEADELEELC
jgi:hypothetical protein